MIGLGAEKMRSLQKVGSKKSQLSLRPCEIVAVDGEGSHLKKKK